jgi:hypothetical protein
MTDDFECQIRSEMAYDKATIEQIERRVNWKAFLAVYGQKRFEEACSFLFDEVDAAIDFLADEREFAEEADPDHDLWLDNRDRARDCNAER